MRHDPNLSDPMTESTLVRPRPAGRLRIGDDWNAIRIIALSQNNQLKALAEFVENSIDARAQHVTVTRGREHGAHYLQISDDGEGVPRDADGAPDFKYVATHICDSIKRRLKADGAQGLQGEFGIGLLSFWTVGQGLTMNSASADGKAYQMHMQKGSPSYRVTQKRTLFPMRGTELKIAPLLPGLRQLSGDKIQWYLASELRDRIRQSGVKIKVIDRTARKEYRVEPRQFSGRLLHQLPAAVGAPGEAYLELYQAKAEATNQVGLYRAGTRVLENIAQLEIFQRPPWTEGVLQGIVDAPFLNLTPGTRSGVIHDENLTALAAALAPVETALIALIVEQRRAEEERASKETLRTIQKAFHEALLALPPEEYDWFDVRAPGSGPGRRPSDGGAEIAGAEETLAAKAADDGPQKRFFEFAGPLYSARIAPSSCVLPVGQSRALRAVARDRARHRVEENLAFRWSIVEGEGRLENADGEIVTFHAAAEPGLVRLALEATQAAVTCRAEAMITVTDTLIPEDKEPTINRQGLPGYSFRRAPGELWRSRYDAEQNVIVINNGHRDFVYAARAKALKLRYIARLFAKELVQKNFPGYPADQLLERMIELSLYTEEHLK